MPERDWKEDSPKHEKPGHAAGSRRFDLSVWHCKKRAAKNFGLVRGGAKRERQHGAIERGTQEAPCEARAHSRQRSEAIIDDEELDQERRAAKDHDIGAREKFERLHSAHPHPSHACGDEPAEDDGQEPDGKRKRQRGEKADEGLGDEIEVHRRLNPSPGACRGSRAPPRRRKIEWSRLSSPDKTGGVQGRRRRADGWSRRRPGLSA